MFFTVLGGGGGGGGGGGMVTHGIGEMLKGSRADGLGQCILVDKDFCVANH